MFDDFIFAFFSLEMSIKMVAMGVYGKNTYLADSWNRLDFFIVLSGALEYCLNMENLNLTAIRTIRVLRPLRAINRIPSKCNAFLNGECLLFDFICWALASWVVADCWGYGKLLIGIKRMDGRAKGCK